MILKTKTKSSVLYPNATEFSKNHTVQTRQCALAAPNNSASSAPNFGIRANHATRRSLMLISVSSRKSGSGPALLAQPVSRKMVGATRWAARCARLTFAGIACKSWAKIRKVTLKKKYKIDWDPTTATHVVTVQVLRIAISISMMIMRKKNLLMQLSNKTYTSSDSSSHRGNFTCRKKRNFAEFANSLATLLLKSRRHY